MKIKTIVLTAGTIEVLGSCAALQLGIMGFLPFSVSQTAFAFWLAISCVIFFDLCAYLFIDMHRGFEGIKQDIKQEGVTLTLVFLFIFYLAINCLLFFVVYGFVKT